jgi:MFS family permease
MGAPHPSGAEADGPAPSPTRSALSPLRLPVYRRLWLASVVSNLGTWMHEAAGAWLMTMLSASPLLVALMQTAASLPFFLLAFPAGALADVVDRRRVLLITQAWMLMAAAALGVATIAGLVTPPVLLGLTFALGVGSAMTSPAWQAITPELVSSQDFTVESWAEHLRQHERMTVADRELVALVRAFHVGSDLPVVTHLIAAPPPTD